MDSKKIENSLLANKWEEDCVEMTLTQNATSNISRYEGKGYLRQGDDGIIGFRLYPSKAENVKAFPFSNDFGTPGKLIESESYYTLTAVDTYGREWVSGRVRPEVSSSSRRETYDLLAGGSCYDLHFERESDYPEKVHFLRIVYFVHLDLPTNASTETVTRRGSGKPAQSFSLNLAEFETKVGRFLVQTEGEKLIIHCNADGPFAPQCALRVTEALSFALGRRLSWNIVEQLENGKQFVRLRGQKDCDETDSLRPIAQTAPWLATQTWRMFEKYLDYVADFHGDQLHLTSAHLFSVYRGHQATIQTRALALSVAVEGMVKEMFGESKPAQTLKREWIAKLRLHCEAWPEFGKAEIKAALWERLRGLLGQLSGTRPKDILFRLAAENVVYTRHVDSWGRLRNRSAHAEDWDPGSLQDVVDLCSARERVGTSPRIQGDWLRGAVHRLLRVRVPAKDVSRPSCDRGGGRGCCLLPVEGRG